MVEVFLHADIHKQLVPWGGGGEIHIAVGTIVFANRTLASFSEASDRSSLGRIVGPLKFLSSLIH